MSNYDLDESAKLKGDSFTFILGGNNYQFKYPTVEESEAMQKMVDSEGNPDNQKITEAMYKFISPVDEKSPPIADAMKKVTSPVLKEFNRMITTELGVE